MPVIVRLDSVMAARGVSGRELAQRIGITEANLSLLRTGKVKGLRFQTLAALCSALACQPGDLLEFAGDGSAPVLDQGDMAVRGDG